MSPARRDCPFRLASGVIISIDTPNGQRWSLGSPIGREQD
jgi:hypothetical protein